MLGGTCLCLLVLHCISLELQSASASKKDQKQRHSPHSPPLFPPHSLALSLPHCIATVWSFVWRYLEARTQIWLPEPPRTKLRLSSCVSITPGIVQNVDTAVKTVNGKYSASEEPCANVALLRCFFRRIDNNRRLRFRTRNGNACSSQFYFIETSLLFREKLKCKSNFSCHHFLTRARCLSLPCVALWRRHGNAVALFTCTSASPRSVLQCHFSNEPAS